MSVLDGLMIFAALLGLTASVLGVRGAIAGEYRAFEDRPIECLGGVGRFAVAVVLVGAAVAIGFTAIALVRGEGTEMAIPEKAAAGNRLAAEGYDLMRYGRRDYAAAEKKLAAAREAGGDSILCLEGLVQCQGNLGRYADAEALLAEMAGLPAGFVRARTLRGWLLAKQDRVAEARAELREAARSGDPDAAGMLAALSSR